MRPQASRRPFRPFISRNRDDYDDAASAPQARTLSSSRGWDQARRTPSAPGAGGRPGPGGGGHRLCVRLFRLHHRHGAVRHHGQVLRVGQRVDVLLPEHVLGQGRVEDVIRVRLALGLDALRLRLDLRGLLLGDILPRLWKRGLPAQEPQWVQYRQAIPTCPVVRTIYESCYSMILIASSRIFRAAFTSRSCNTPHDGHAHSRTLKSLTRGFL